MTGFPSDRPISSTSDLSSPQPREIRKARPSIRPRQCAQMKTPGLQVARLRHVLATLQLKFRQRARELVKLEGLVEEVAGAQIVAAPPERVRGCIRDDDHPRLDSPLAYRPENIQAAAAIEENIENDHG